MKRKIRYALIFIVFAPIATLSYAIHLVSLLLRVVAWLMVLNTQSAKNEITNFLHIEY